MKRLAGKVALIVGAGQSSGESLGNGRAMALTFADHGASIVAADHRLSSAEETVALIREKSGTALAVYSDVCSEESLGTAVDVCLQTYGRIDILVNNVGVSVAGGDTSLDKITEEIFDRIMAINIRGTVMACKQVLPQMRIQKEGVIINIASTAAYMIYPWVAYKISKAGMIEFTRQVAIQNAQFNIRANAILPGLINTPMAVDTRAREFKIPREEIEAQRDAQVPLGRKMGTAQDVAFAALYLASDEARFITGIELPVDGGMLCNIAGQSI